MCILHFIWQWDELVSMEHQNERIHLGFIDLFAYGRRRESNELSKLWEKKINRTREQIRFSFFSCNRDQSRDSQKWKASNSKRSFFAFGGLFRSLSIKGAEKTRSLPFLFQFLLLALVSLKVSKKRRNWWKNFNFLTLLWARMNSLLVTLFCYNKIKVKRKKFAFYPCFIFIFY